MCCKRVPGHVGCEPVFAFGFRQDLLAVQGFNPIKLNLEGMSYRDLNLLAGDFPLCIGVGAHKVVECLSQEFSATQ